MMWLCRLLRQQRQLDICTTFIIVFSKHVYGKVVTEHGLSILGFFFLRKIPGSFRTPHNCHPNLMSAIVPYTHA